MVAAASVSAFLVFQVGCSQGSRGPTEQRRAEATPVVSAQTVIVHAATVILMTPSATPPPVAPSPTADPRRGDGPYGYWSGPRCGGRSYEKREFGILPDGTFVANELISPPPTAYLTTKGTHTVTNNLVKLNLTEVGRPGFPTAFRYDPKRDVMIDETVTPPCGYPRRPN